MNNPTIDGVSRELLGDLLKLASRNVKSAWSGGICERAQAILDAPAVKRQAVEIASHWSDYSCVNLRVNGQLRMYVESCQPEPSAALQSTIAQLQARAADLESGLGGMLFAFDDGVGRGWSEKLLDYARKLTPAVEFDATAALNEKPKQ